jgi:hypothetical protein
MTRNLLRKSITCAVLFRISYSVSNQVKADSEEGGTDEEGDFEGLVHPNCFRKA